MIRAGPSVQVLVILSIIASYHNHGVSYIRSPDVLLIVSRCFGLFGS